MHDIYVRVMLYICAFLYISTFMYVCIARFCAAVKHTCTNCLCADFFVSQDRDRKWIPLLMHHVYPHCHSLRHRNECETHTLLYTLVCTLPYDHESIVCSPRHRNVCDTHTHFCTSVYAHCHTSISLLFAVSYVACMHVCMNSCNHTSAKQKACKVWLKIIIISILFLSPLCIYI
jgi:hypothetical protein